MNQFSLEQYPVFLGAKIIQQKDDVYNISTIDGVFVIKSSNIMNIIKAFSDLKGQCKVKELNLDSKQIENFKIMLDIGMVTLLDKPLDLAYKDLFIYLTRYIKKPEKAIQYLKSAAVIVKNDILSCDVSEVFQRLNIQNVREDTTGEITVNENDIYITVSYNDTAYLEKVNKKMIESKCTWIPVIVDQTFAQFGPIQKIPETACMDCLYQATGTDLEEKMVYNDFQMIPSIQYKINGILFDILLQIICNCRKETLWGKVIKMNYNSEEIHINKVLKLSTCKSCQEKDFVPIKRWEYEL